MSTVVLLAIPDVGLVWCGMKSTTEEVSKKVEQAVPMLNRYTTNTCTLPILYWRYSDTYCRQYRGWLLTNGWLIHPPILDRYNYPLILGRYINWYVNRHSPNTQPIYQRTWRLTPPIRQDTRCQTSTNQMSLLGIFFRLILLSNLEMNHYGCSKKFSECDISRKHEK